MKGGETGESQQRPLPVWGLGRRERLRLTLRKHRSGDTLKTQDVWFSCFPVSLFRSEMTHLPSVAECHQDSEG